HLEPDRPLPEDQELHVLGGRPSQRQLAFLQFRGRFVGGSCIHACRSLPGGWARQPATRRTRAKLRLPTCSTPSKPGANTCEASSTTSPSTLTARSLSLRLASDLDGVMPAAVSSAARRRPAAGTATPCRRTRHGSPR